MDVALLPPPQRLLLALCRRGPVDRLREAIHPGARPEALLERLTTLAVRHSVQGLVLSRLMTPEGAVEPFGGLEESIRPGLSLVTRQATLWDMEQDRVLTGLERTGIRPLVLKGAALRRWVFAKPVERAMGDLDILVARDEVPAVLDSLRELGYRSPYTEAARSGFRSHHHHERVTHPNGFHVEVHWGLTRPGAPMALDAERFLERSRTVRGPRGREVRVPSPEDMVIHTVSQSQQGQVRELRRLVDLDRVVAAETVDWDYVRREATRARLLPALCVTHRLTALLLGTPVPGDLQEGRGLPWSSRTGVALTRPVARLLRERSRAQVPHDHLFRIWCLPTWRRRGRWLRRIVSGVGDPLEWVWGERDEAGTGEPGGRPGRGTVLLVKLAVLQATLLASAVRESLKPGGRGRMRFWKGPPEG